MQVKQRNSASRDEGAGRVRGSLARIGREPRQRNKRELREAIHGGAAKTTHTQGEREQHERERNRSRRGKGAGLSSTGLGLVMLVGRGSSGGGWLQRGTQAAARCRSGTGRDREEIGSRAWRWCGGWLGGAEIEDDGRRQDGMDGLGRCEVGGSGSRGDPEGSDQAVAAGGWGWDSRPRVRLNI